MKKTYFLLLAFLSFQFAIQAQSEATVEQEVEQISTLYDMNATQTYYVRQMVEMKAFNQQELKVLEAEDSELYENKLRNLDRQFRLGIRSVLTEEQLVKYRTLLEEERKQIGQRIAQLKADGAEKTEIAKAISELKAIQ